MSTLDWSESLALNQPSMDATHHEFVDLLHAVDDALGGDGRKLEAALDALVEHTETHFAQEEHWMLAAGFSSQNCHSYHHAQVLRAMHEVLDRLRDEHDVALVRQLADELAEWFPAHSRSMDAGLAQAMAAAGYDPGGTSRPVPERAAVSDETCAH